MTARRSWFITINNYSAEELRDVLEFDCKYSVTGRETGEEKGTPHIHSYMEFGKPVRFQTMKNNFPRADIEPRKGTAKQAIAYCKKQGDFTEKGEPSKQGHRTDLDEVAEAVMRGDPIPTIAQAFPTTFIRCHRGIEHFRETLQKHRDRENPPTVIWIYGQSGTGKSRLPHDIHGDTCVYIKDGTQWWNNYTQQEAIVIDDFDGKWPYRELLRLIDRYAFQGQTKGGYVKINSPYIYITCEYPPERFWSNNELAQIKRRITHTFEFH